MTAYDHDKLSTLEFYALFFMLGAIPFVLISQFYELFRYVALGFMSSALACALAIGYYVFKGRSDN